MDGCEHYFFLLIQRILNWKKHLRNVRARERFFTRTRRVLNTFKRACEHQVENACTKCLHAKYENIFGGKVVFSVLSSRLCYPIHELIKAVYICGKLNYTTSASRDYRILSGGARRPTYSLLGTEAYAVMLERRSLKAISYMLLNYGLATVFFAEWSSLGFLPAGLNVYGFFTAKIVNEHRCARRTSSEFAFEAKTWRSSPRKQL